MDFLPRRQFVVCWEWNFALFFFHSGDFALLAHVAPFDYFGNGSIYARPVEAGFHGGLHALDTRVL
jgi:hypothetical protein